MKVWQIATGDSGRDYSGLFFDHDIMIIGPSDKGDALKTIYADGIPNSSGSQVHNFAHCPDPGDRVLMRFGKQVIGVGQIPADENAQYSFDETFASVYGWDLCHTRRVKWAQNYDLCSLANVYSQSKQKPSFTGVQDPNILKLVEQIANNVFGGDLKELPTIDTSLYDDENLGLELFRAGVSNRNIDDILSTLRQAERLCSWYWSDFSGRYPTEQEVISHIVLPLFLGLGWSHQQIAVEWQKVDMALFINTPTTAENCVMAIEAKGLGKALGDVFNQPVGYINSLKLENVKCLVTTDGANLFVYQRDTKSMEWDQTPIGYLSVPRLQREYVLPKGTDLVQTLVMLQPTRF